MPIKPENKHRYPADWKAIRAAILERACNRCEWPGCGLPHRSWVLREGESLVTLWYGPTQAEAKAKRRELIMGQMLSVKLPVEVVLTIAHLDHTPENCAPANLRAWCQMHHNRYDLPNRRLNAKETLRKRRGQLELFGEALGRLALAGEEAQR